MRLQRPAVHTQWSSALAEDRHEPHTGTIAMLPTAHVHECISYVGLFTLILVKFKMPATGELFAFYIWFREAH